MAKSKAPDPQDVEKVARKIVGSNFAGCGWAEDTDHLNVGVHEMPSDKDTAKLISRLSKLGASSVGILLNGEIIAEWNPNAENSLSPSDS